MEASPFVHPAVSKQGTQLPVERFVAVDRMGVKAGLHRTVHLVIPHLRGNGKLQMHAAVCLISLIDACFSGRAAL